MTTPAADHWRRDEPSFYNFLALERTAGERPGALDGLRGALMSRDRASMAETHIVELAPGWRKACADDAASLELFVLSGDLALNGEAVGAGGYVHVPQGSGGGELSSPNGAVALAFSNPNLPCFPYPYTLRRVVGTQGLGWRNSVPGGHGVMHKSLRLPDPCPDGLEGGFDGGPGGYLRFQYIAPQMIAAAEHVHHECWEEIIVLAGDVLLINEGQMGRGSVVGHPQEWYHAPFASRTGAVILVHTDAPMGYPWPPRDYPGGQALCEGYLKAQDLTCAIDHIAWQDHPLAGVQQADPAYNAWRRTPGGRLWGDADDPGDVPYLPGGRGTASAFRASWRRQAS